MSRPTMFISLLLASTGALLAQDVAAKKPLSRQSSQKPGGQVLPVVEIPNQKFVLANGLRVIVHEDRKTPVVSVGVWYHVGSANETPGRTGFAHLFEHLMFNGSQNAPEDWFKVMNEVGASGMNGSTGFDRTNYYQTVPTAALDRLLWLESDRMENLLPAVDQATLDEQRGVVQNEKRQGANTPLGQVPDMLYAATYPVGHPYSWTPIGSMEDLNAANLSDVGAFFKKWYGPGNVVLVLSGDISAAEAKEKVERYFGNIPPGPALKRSSEQPAKMVGETRGVIDVPTANSQLFKVWNVPGWSNRDAQLLGLATEVFSHGQNSRLQKRLVRELKLASDVSMVVNLQELGSQVHLSATAMPGVTLKQLEAALDQEIAGLLRDGLTTAEVERVKFARYARFVAGQSSTMAKGNALAEGELYAGTPDFYRTRQQIIYSATAAELLDVSRKWLSDGVYVLEARARPQLAATGKPVDRSTKPAVGPAANFRLAPLQHATLSNGIRVSLAERHDVPTVTMAMMFNFGALPDRDPNSTGSNLALSLASLGTRTRSALEIAAEQQSLGAGIGWQAGPELSRYNMSALKLKLDETLDLYADILLNPVFPQQEWDRIRDLYISNYEDNKRTPTGKLSAVYSKMIYGADHPYAAQLTPEIARKLTISDFQKFYNQWVRPDLATILIVGDTTLAEIMPKLEQRFRGWRAPAAARPAAAELPKPVPPAGARVVMVDNPGAESSLISVAHTGPARSAPDFEALSVANTVLGGHFISRLNTNLREEKGWSYGMKSALGEATYLSMIEAGGSVQTDKTADALGEVARELRELASNRPPTSGEIQAAKNAMLLSFPATVEGPGGAFSLYRRTYEDRLPEDYWNSYVQKVQSLTPEEIKQASARLFRPSELTWFVVGDLSKIEADVRKLKLGDVQIFDEDGNRVR